MSSTDGPLYLDFETRSIFDVKKIGVYRYTEHPSTRVLCFSAAWGGYTYETNVIDFDTFPAWLQEALKDPSTLIHAHNAAFERLVIQNIATPRHGWPRIAASRFRCSAARVARLALPRALDKAGSALGLDVTKDKDGALVMRRLCKPTKFTAAGPVYDDDPNKMHRLMQYCSQDVRAEMAIDKATFPMPPSEERFYQMTEKINDRGVLVDIPLVKRLIWRANECVGELNAEMQKITGGQVGALTEVAKLKAWVYDQTGTVIESLGKEHLEGMLDEASNYNFPEHVKRAIKIRQEGAKSSVAKLVAILNRVSMDGRLRGPFVFNGASTGRYSSMGVQLQNLKRDTLKDFDNDIRRLEEFTMDEISRTLRQVFIAAPNHILIDSDFNAIEARGVGWLFGAKKLLSHYHNGRDPYCEMASVIYKFIVTKENEWERFVGKQTILGCGYGMGPDKFYAQCVRFGQEVPMDICQKAVESYREEFWQIPAGWYDVTDASVNAVKYPGKEFAVCNGKLIFKVQDGYLQMKLPNGRRLFYKSPRVEIEHKISRRGNAYEAEVLSYMAQHSITRQWVREKAWGGKLTENAVQAFCRDLLFEGMEEMEYGWDMPIVLSVHDQIVNEIPIGDAEWGVRKAKEILEYAPDWASGFPIAAAPKIAMRFGK